MKQPKDYRANNERKIKTIIMEFPENSAQMKQFRENHPRLYHWYHTALGKVYLEQHGGGL